MQTRLIARLARKLRKTYRLTKSWRQTAQACHVLTPEKAVNPGLAKRIAMDGYSPSVEVTHRLIADGAVQVRAYRQQGKMIIDMTPAELTWALQHRQPMTTEG